MSRSFSRRCCNPLFTVKYLRFRLFAVLLSVVSVTSLALVIHRTASFPSGDKLQSPFSSTETVEVLVKKNVAGNIRTRTESKVVQVVEKNNGNSSAACRLPVLDPYHPSVVHFMKDLGKLQCNGASFSSFQNNVLRVDGEGIISAQYRKIERTPGKDFGVVLSDPVKVQSTSEQKGELFLQFIPS